MPDTEKIPSDWGPSFVPGDRVVVAKYKVGAGRKGTVLFFAFLHDRCWWVPVACDHLRTPRCEKVERLRHA